MIVAVLGGGNGGYATAADLALAGHRVRWWRRSGADAAPPTLALTGEGRQGDARLERTTGDLRDALDGADVVIVPLPATAQEDVARQLAPHVRETQIIVLTPGTLGAYVAPLEIGLAGGTLPFATAETGTLPYLTRKTGAAAVAAPVLAANLPVGVFPASRSEPVLARLRELFPALRPCVDVLDTALTNAGPVIHPPLVLLNAGAIDAGRFDVHAAGTTASVRRLIDAVDAERVASRRGLGYPAPHYEVATLYDESRAAEGLYGAGAHAKLVASGLWEEVLTLEHRYVTEDVALGLSLFESAARTAVVESPATTGLLQVFGALLGRTLTGRGRALDHLGLGEFTLREVRSLMQEGWTSALWARAMKAAEQRAT